MSLDWTFSSRMLVKIVGMGTGIGLQKKILLVERCIICLKIKLASASIYVIQDLCVSYNIEVCISCLLFSYILF